MKLIYFLLLTFLISSCKDKDDKSISISPSSKTYFLTSDSSKKWNMIWRTPEEGEAVSCTPSSEREKDNTWIFYSNGDFEFDQGLITEDPTCVDGCCIDMLSVVGKWEFTENETRLKVRALHIKGYPNSTIPESQQLLFDVKIEKLQEKELLFSVYDNEKKVTMEAKLEPK